MDTITITKAVQAAEAFTKGVGEPPTLRSQDFEDAMFALAAQRRAPGEDDATAFARLTKDRDPDIEVLWAAAALKRVHENHGEALRKRQAASPLSTDKARGVMKSAAKNLDDYVAMRKQAGEGIEAAYGRLARTGDAQFVDLYRALDEARRYAVG